MGPKRTQRPRQPQNNQNSNETKQSENNNSQTQIQSSSSSSSSNNRRKKNNNPSTTSPVTVAQTKPKSKSRGFFCCCGSSAEDVYNNEISRVEEMPAAPKEILTTTSRPSKKNLNNGTASTASVGSTNSVPTRNHEPLGTMNSDLTKRGNTSTSNRSNTNRTIEIADVTELDTSVGSTDKVLPHTRSFTENQTNPTSTGPTLKPTQSRHELIKSNPPPSNPAHSGRDNPTLHGVYGTVAPVTATVAPNPSFNEMNRMFEGLNIKFDRSQPTAGEQITIGDTHLAKLEEGCKLLLEKLLEEKHQRYQYFSELQSSEHDSPTTAPPQVSGDYTEVAIIFTEVLQLQNRPREAVQVLSKAIEILNTDLIHAKHHRQTSNVIPSTSPNSSFVASSPTSMNSLTTHLTKPQVVSAAEFEQLKKMKGLCHRRLGSLYKIIGRYPESEDHIKKYISILNRQGASTGIRREKANAYALLATIYELMDKPDQALAADKQALEIASSLITP